MSYSLYKSLVWLTNQTFSMAEGRVRAVGLRKFLATDGRDEVFEVNSKMVITTIRSNPGDRGGPLLDTQGKIVGISQSVGTAGNHFTSFVDITELHALLKEKNLMISEGTASTVETPALVAQTTVSVPAPEYVPCPRRKRCLFLRFHR